MGNGIDVCMGDPREASTIEDCLESEFVGCLVRQAGLVILGKKPAAVFGFKPRAWKGGEARLSRSLVSQLVSIYAKKCEPFGVRLVWLARKGEDVMLLAWRPAQVASIMKGGEAQAFLAESGLPTSDENRLMAALVARLRASYAGRAQFPHEVGLVLGYPIEDVRGFMAAGGRDAKTVGLWKVYGDPARARRRMEELERQERRVKRLYSEGTPVRELLRMGAA